MRKHVKTEENANNLYGFVLLNDLSEGEPGAIETSSGWHYTGEGFYEYITLPYLQARADSEWFSENMDKEVFAPVANDIIVKNYNGMMSQYHIDAMTEACVKEMRQGLSSFRPRKDDALKYFFPYIVKGISKYIAAKPFPIQSGSVEQADGWIKRYNNAHGTAYVYDDFAWPQGLKAKNITFDTAGISEETVKILTDNKERIHDGLIAATKMKVLEEKAFRSLQKYCVRLITGNKAFSPYYDELMMVSFDTIRKQLCKFDPKFSSEPSKDTAVVNFLTKHLTNAYKVYIENDKGRSSQLQRDIQRLNKQCINEGTSVENITVEEAAEMLGVTAERASEVLREMRTPTTFSLDINKGDDEWEFSIDVADKSSNTAHEVEAKELMMDVQEAINDLPEKERIVILNWKEFNPSNTRQHEKDIAEALGVPAFEVQNIRNRAKKHLANDPRILKHKEITVDKTKRDIKNKNIEKPVFLDDDLDDEDVNTEN